MIHLASPMVDMLYAFALLVLDKLTDTLGVENITTSLDRKG